MACNWQMKPFAPSAAPSETPKKAFLLRNAWVLQMVQLTTVLKSSIKYAVEVKPVGNQIENIEHMTSTYWLFDPVKVAVNDILIEPSLRRHRFTHKASRGDVCFGSRSFFCVHMKGWIRKECYQGWNRKNCHQPDLALTALFCSMRTKDSHTSNEIEGFHVSRNYRSCSHPLLDVGIVLSKNASAKVSIPSPEDNTLECIVY